MCCFLPRVLKAEEEMEEFWSRPMHHGCSLLVLYVENNKAFHRRVKRGGSGGPDLPLFLDPPFSSVTFPSHPTRSHNTNIHVV